MRSFLTLIAGSPGRVCTTAAFAVTIAFILAGHGWDLARASWFALIFAAAFTFAFAILAMAGAAIGVDGDSPRPAPREADRG